MLIWTGSRKQRDLRHLFSYCGVRWRNELLQKVSLCSLPAFHASLRCCSLLSRHFSPSWNPSQTVCLSPLHRLCLSLSSNLFPPFPSASFLHPSSSCRYCTSIRMCESETCLRCLVSAAEHSGKLNGTAASLVSLSLVSLSICASEESGAFCPSAPEEIMRCQRRVTAPPLNSECKNPAKIVAQGRRGLRNSFHLVLGARGARSRSILSSMPLRSARQLFCFPQSCSHLRDPRSTVHVQQLEQLQVQRLHTSVRVCL